MRCDTLVGLRLAVVGAVVAATASRAFGEIRVFSTLLDGECAATGSAGRGWGEFTLDMDTGELTYRIFFGSLSSSPYDAHIHGPIEQACGSSGSGDIVVGLGVASPTGSAVLSPQEQSELMRGLYYVNVHTSNFTFGEVAGVLQHVHKNRTISVAAPPSPAAAGAAAQGVRVRLRRMYIGSGENAVRGCPARTALPDLAAFEGATSYRWLGPPTVVSDGTVPPNADYLVASLQCCPYFRDWTPEGLAAEFGDDVDVAVIHAVGAAVVPCSAYEVQYVDASCTDLNDEECYTYPLYVQTAKSGDIVSPYGFTGQPNFNDIAAAVACFKAIPMPGGQNKLRCLLRGNDLPLADKVNFTDISRVIAAFRVLPYPEPGPASCDPCP